MQSIRLIDDATVVEFTWNGIFAYLGFRNIIASALMTRLFVRAFADLSPGRPPDREEISMLTAFPGPGILDSIELVTRLPIRHPERLVINPGAGPAEAPEAPKGRFYFEVGVASMRRGYWPPEELFDDHFRDQVRHYQSGSGTPEEQRDYRAFKEEKTHAILDYPEERIFYSWPITS